MRVLYYNFLYVRDVIGSVCVCVTFCWLETNPFFLSSMASAVLLALFGLVVSAEETCKNGIEVYRNGESIPVTTLSPSLCLESRNAFEAAISIAGCDSDGAKCEARDGTGRRVSSCNELDVPKVYAVPRDKRFVFSTEHVGFERYVERAGVTLVTTSLRPRLFEMRGFLDEGDADALIADALAIDDDEHRLMRSSTGAKGYNPSRHRTSENAWVKHTKTAEKLKRRAFDLLGFDHYAESMADGLQLLRYNESNAYVAHTDYLTRPAEGVTAAQMDPAQGGANRFATLFLYLSDVEEGGQTVFPNVDPPSSTDKLPDDLLQTSAALSEDVKAIRDSQGSWEKKMVDDCYSKLAVRPRKARAILYYSQHPDGSLDLDSRHGGCPVLKGQKWAANLWVWNKAMPFGSSRFNNSSSTSSRASAKDSLSVVFTYRGTRFKTGPSVISLYWNDEVKMGDFEPPYMSLDINTFVGHSFTAKTDDGLLLAKVTVERDKLEYVFFDNGEV